MEKKKKINPLIVLPYYPGDWEYDSTSYTLNEPQGPSTPSSLWTGSEVPSQNAMCIEQKGRVMVTLYIINIFLNFIYPFVVLF